MIVGWKNSLQARMNESVASFFPGCSKLSGVAREKLDAGYRVKCDSVGKTNPQPLLDYGFPWHKVLSRHKDRIRGLSVTKKHALTKLLKIPM